MLHEAETWAQANKMDVTEMRMLRWMTELIRKEKRQGMITL